MSLQTGDDTVTVNPDDYVGRDVHEVTDELKGLGLEPRPEKQTNDGTHQENTVASLDPTGELHQGDPITVYYWDKVLKEPKPPKPHGPKPKPKPKVKGPKR